MVRAILTLALASFAAAQSGTITGTVSDHFQARLAKASIQAVNAATHAAFSTQSAADGSFTLAQLPPGTYTLVASVPGMIPFAQPNLAVGAAQSVRVDAVLDDLNSNTLGEDRNFYANMFSPSGVPSGPAPRTADGKPDLSGVWRPNFPSDPGQPQPLPWAAAIAKQWADDNGKDVPTRYCRPGGMEIETLVGPYKLVQTPTLLVILFDEGDLPRQIYLDGRAHPTNWNPSWVGHSVGHWEGDTLVVDTVGFNNKSWIGPPFHPHTDQLHVTERFRRPDAGHLEIQTTYEDPGALSKPWTMKKVSALAPAGEDVAEYICTENERDASHIVGK